MAVFYVDFVFLQALKYFKWALMGQGYVDTAPIEAMDTVHDACDACPVSVITIK